MAKSQKGKKTSRIEQKAVKQEAVVQKETVVPAAQTVQAEKPVTVRPANFVGFAVNFVKAHFTLFTVAIILLMAFMFYLRAVPSHDSIFTNWPWINGSTYVNVAADDGVYHMRLLYNTLEHFPFRILYDPFTHFPYGNTIHFGPLFELIPAAFLLIVGLGNPGQMLIDSVAAYYPAVLGTLVIIPVYYIGKKLFGRPAGLAGAIVLAFIPGTFFFRSVLGSFDHHIAEVLFMACTIACLVYALDAASKQELSFEQLKKRDRKALRGPLLYSALTGIFFGCYLLTWVGALLLAFALFVYFTVQAVIDHYSGRSLEPLVIISALVFLIPVIMVLPYSSSNLTFQSVYYSITQPLLFSCAFAGICIEYGLSKLLRGSKAEKWAFPAALVGAGVIGLLLMYMAIPGLFGIVQYSLTQLMPSGGTTTIGEAFPTFVSQYTLQFSFGTVWQNYYLAFPAAILGLVLLAISVLMTRRPAEIMFLVWCLVMGWALIAQNRYTYYFAVNVALLTAYLTYRMLGLAGFDGARAAFARTADGLGNLQRFVKKNTGSSLAILIVVLLFCLVAVYPALPMSDVYQENKEGALLWAAKSSGSSMPYEWYDALTWMRNHTPDPQGSPVSASFDYWNGQYYKSPLNKTFNYPSSAYGVMSWWDYGHQIEYIANRIPNANPFQAGIIEENGTTGASPFFCSTDEAKSVEMLDKLGSRYVVIDNQMVNYKFGPIQEWIKDTDGWGTLTTGNLTTADTSSGSLYDSGIEVYTIVDSDKWANSTINRLYYYDADGMSHYRLVYESDGQYALNLRYMQYDDNGQFVSGGLMRDPLRIDNYTDAVARYDLFSNFILPQNDQGTIYVYGARPPAKWVKIFEKVEGATLEGSAPDGSDVKAVLTLKADDGRVFNYTASAVAHNGSYSFVVPYPTEQMKGDGYSYGIVPQSKYVVTYGNTTKSVDVPESAVMNGGVVQVI